MKWLVGIIIAIIIIGAGWYLWSSSAPTSTGSTTATTTPSQTYGMSEYTDPNGFTFWYPSSVTVTATTTSDTASFPGGTETERLQVGDPGGTYIAVVHSPSSTITDEPNGHASPIPQTKYFFDGTSSEWMVAYPEGAPTTGKSSTTTADTSKSSVGQLTMLPSGARFDTTIIPLSKTTFLVVGDGGGSSYTSQLAFTVAPTNAQVDPSALSAALQSESNAYSASQ